MWKKRTLGLNKKTKRSNRLAKQFILPETRLQLAGSPIQTQAMSLISNSNLAPVTEQGPGVETLGYEEPNKIRFSKLIDLMHEYSLASFSILILIILLPASQIVANIWSSQIYASADKTIKRLALPQAVIGLNLIVPTSQLQSKLSSISSQSDSLTVGGSTLSISPSTIKSWLKINYSQDNSEAYIHVSSQTIDQSLLSLANQYVKAPVNQISVTHTDGITPSGVILAGSNGTSLSDPSSLNAQAEAAAKNVLKSNNALNFTTPLKTVPFQNVTPANFSKFIEVNVSTKRLYAYQNGQLVNTFLASTGKPSTPTPLGEFHIWDKLTSQTMVGPGYVQPNVPYVNYFDHSGDAIHGVYWRPMSVFGNVNTSHGCVGLEIPDAQWIFNWAPIGTPVVTYSS